MRFDRAILGLTLVVIPVRAATGGDTSWMPANLATAAQVVISITNESGKKYAVEWKNTEAFWQYCPSDYTSKDGNPDHYVLGTLSYKFFSNPIMEKEMPSTPMVKMEYRANPIISNPEQAILNPKTNNNLIWNSSGYSARKAIIPALHFRLYSDTNSQLFSLTWSKTGSSYVVDSPIPDKIIVDLAPGSSFLTIRILK